MPSQACQFKIIIVILTIFLCRNYHCHHNFVLILCTLLFNLATEDDYEHAYLTLLRNNIIPHVNKANGEIVLGAYRTLKSKNENLYMYHVVFSVTQLFIVYSVSRCTVTMAPAMKINKMNQLKVISAL